MQAFRAALCQVRAFDLEEAEANLANILRALDEAGQAGAQLVALPECAYPADYVRDRDPYARPGVRPYAEVEALLAGKAKEHGYWLAAGLAVPHAGGALTNSGVVFAPDGSVRGRYDKSFLWHFDNDWFTPGQAYPVFDAGFVRFGVLICADGRIPEIARSLAVDGAEVIVDLTAWVSSGRAMGELSTTQCEYLMPTRAFENGAWVIAADKWGTEDGHSVYAGRSTVIDPLGQTRVCAASDREEVVVFDLEPVDVALVPRRPALYGLLTAPTETLPVIALEDEPLVPSRAGRRVAVVPSDDSGFQPVDIAARYRGLRAQGTALVVFGGMRAPEGWRAGMPALTAAVKDAGGALAVGLATGGLSPEQWTVLVTAEGVTEHQATHGRGIATGEINAPVLRTEAGNVGLLCGEEGIVPEVARMLALQGADTIAWPLFAEHAMRERVQRARSDEGRLFVAAAWPGGAAITSPEGAPIAISPAGSGVAMTATVSLALSRAKERAPGTNVIRNRFPAAYGALVR